MREDGENEREKLGGIYANPSAFHRDWDRVPFKHPLPKMESGHRERGESRGHHLPDPHIGF